MLQSQTLAVHVNGRDIHLSFEKYPVEHLSNAPYHSNEVSDYRALLPSGQTIAEFKASVLTTFKSQKGSAPIKLIQLQDQVAQREFGKPFPAIVHNPKEAVRKRYVAACASSNNAFKLDELRACARLGHLQANMDLALLLDAEGNPDCVDYFVDAHNLGHPESMLCLSKTLFKTGDAGAAVRVLLLGTWCGSIRCAQLLLELRKHKLPILETPECLAALKDSSAYGSIQAKYLLGFVLLHGKRCRDEARGRTLIIEASEVPHFRADKGKGAPLDAGRKQFPAGTLAHFERLIDEELLAIRSKELEPQFLAEAAKLPCGDSEATRAAFEELLQEFNPATQRMTHRSVKYVGDWLAEGDELVDEAKLERMKRLALPDEGTAKESGHD